MGINIDSISDYSRAWVYADAMKTARSFNKTNSADFNSNVALDANGWPMEDFQTMVFTDQPDSVKGTYKLSFTGKANVTAKGGTVENLKYDIGTNRTSADISVNSGQLVLSFTGVLPGLRDIKLNRPSDPETGNTFSKNFLRAIEPFQVIRFMDLLRTNNSTVSKWSERSTPTDAIIKTLPWEHVIELANIPKPNLISTLTLGFFGEEYRDIWINIPAQADDDYVKQLATLLKEKLNAKSKVYVEYSNEVWNSIFTQFKENQAAAEAEVAAAGGKLDLSLDGTDTNKYFWARRRVAKRLITVSTLLKTSLGGDRVRPIYAAQIADPSHFKVGLEYIKKYWGEPKDLIWAIAGAPYFAYNQATWDSPELTPQAVYGLLASSIESQAKNWKKEPPTKLNSAKLPDWNTTFGQHAYFWGLRTVSYEAGQHITSTLPIQKIVHSSIEIGRLFSRYYQLGIACGMEFMNQFAFVTAQPSDRGYAWGMTDSLSNLDTPKYNAVLGITKMRVEDIKKSIPCQPGQPLYPAPTPRPTAAPTPAATPGVSS